MSTHIVHGVNYNPIPIVIDALAQQLEVDLNPTVHDLTLLENKS